MGVIDMEGQDVINEHLNSRVSALEVKVAVHDAELASIKHKMDKIESNSTWTFRIIVGTLVLSVLDWLLKGGAA
jgi:hypothetical protein